MNIAQLFNNFKNTILTKYGSNPAKMLIYTGVLGWFLSSAAQVVAIAVNDKIPKEQKMFLIPQEIGDGAINVVSFFLVTSVIKNFASRLVSSGRLATPKIREFLTNSEINIKTKNGWKVLPGFDFSKFNIKNMTNFDQISDEYNSFKNGVDVIAMTLGSILSCNIITPILRNKYATNRQRKVLAEFNKPEIGGLKYPKGISMDTYQKQVTMKFSKPSASLKI